MRPGTRPRSVLEGSEDHPKRPSAAHRRASVASRDPYRAATRLDSLSTRITLSEAADELARARQERDRAHPFGDTYKRPRSGLRNPSAPMCCPNLGHLRLSAISRVTIQDLVDELTASGAAPSTVRNANPPATSALPHSRLPHRRPCQPNRRPRPPRRTWPPRTNRSRPRSRRSDQGRPDARTQAIGLPPSTPAYAWGSSKPSAGRTSICNRASCESNAAGTARRAD